MPHIVLLYIKQMVLDYDRIQIFYYYPISKNIFFCCYPSIHAMLGIQMLNVQFKVKSFFVGFWIYVCSVFVVCTLLNGNK